MPHNYPFNHHTANPAESVSAEGTKFEFPTGDKLVFDKQGRAYRVLGEITLGNGKRQLKLETFNPFVTQQARLLTIDKGEIGGRYDIRPSSAPARIIGTRRMRDRTPDLSLPRITTSDVATIDDCLVVTFSASELVRAVVYYDVAAQGGPHPVYDIGYGNGPTLGRAPITSNVGGDFGPYEPGSEPYTFPFSYGYGGYSLTRTVADFNTDHIVNICGLVTGVTYNVLICVFDKSNNGPICSDNITVFLPTP